MKKDQLKCPYCGRKLSFFETMNIKENLEFYCEHCKNKSKIKVSKNLKTLIVTLIALTLACFLIFSFVIRMLLIGSFIISLLFLGFYLLVPKLMVLKKE